MSMIADHEFRQRMDHIETLVERIAEHGDPETRAVAEEAIAAILEFHAAGIDRMLEIVVTSGAPAPQLLTDFGQDDLVASLLLLHGLHPVPLEERVRAALASVRPYLQSHGGNVELLDVEDGVIKLRLEGSCHGCPSSLMTLKLAIEKAINEHAPDSAGIEVDGLAPAPATQLPPIGFVSLDSLMTQRPPGASTAWTDLGDVRLPVKGETRMAEVEGLSLLLCRVDESLFAYRSTCSGCGKTLGDARMMGSELICTSCSRAYDLVHAGRCLQDGQIMLDPLPLLEEAGHVRVATPARRS